MSEKRCDLCEFWCNTGGRYANVSQCRRTPVFIERSGGQWCGEFQPRDNPEWKTRWSGTVESSYSQRGLILVDCGATIPKQGDRIEMRIVKGPGGEA